MTRRVSLPPRTWVIVALAALWTQVACGAPAPDEPEVQQPAAAQEVVHESGGEPDAEPGPRELASFDPQLGLAREWTGDLDGMVERRYLRALVTSSKTHYFLDGAVQRGLAYEGLRELEKFLNQRLATGTLKLNVVILPVERDELIPALERGLGDLAAANLTVTPGRLERVDFAEPFTRSVEELVVTGPGSAKLASLDRLSGLEVHVRRSSSFWQSLEAVNRGLAERGLAPVEVVQAEEFLETEDLLEMVNAGLIPATVADSHIVDFWREVFDGLVVHDGIPIREGGSIAWAVRKGCPQLKAAVDDFARANRVGTLTTNTLLKRYLQANPWVRNPMTAADRKRFEATVHLFQRYGERYGFDHLMLTALAYQESRLDQTVRSRAGAVGVMQIRPTTAADPNVGIPDVAGLEDNIHAGTKYLAFLRDRYFSDPELDEVNRTLLTFAAYNAGPARVRQLRADAEERGLDPDRWFGNVEVSAARRIGRETVQYVGNIAKYWVAYRLAARQMERKAGDERLTGGG